MLPSMAICGTARNCGASLASTLKVIDRIRAASSASTVIVVTNDNNDETEKVLCEWSRTNRDVALINCDGLVTSHPNRMDRLAAARNVYLKALRDQSKAFDVLAVLDLDGPNDELRPEAIASALSGVPNDWVGAFANQASAYYDLAALRRPMWVEEDAWSQALRVNERLRATNAVKMANQVSGGRLYSLIYRTCVRKYVYDRQYRIDPRHPPIAVDSAFGGLGLYRYDAAVASEYSSRTPVGDIACEHVAFNLSTNLRGGKLYICPGLLNLAQELHLGPGSGAPFPRRLHSRA